MSQESELVKRGIIMEGLWLCSINLIWNMWRAWMDGRVTHRTTIEYNPSNLNFGGILDWRYSLN